jgi:two-component system, OmpR family, response regulator
MSEVLANHKFLVVDDQLLVRTLISQVLHSFGLPPDHILQATDGQHALRVLSARRVDLVLCDMQMSPVNGMDLLKAIRCGRTANSPDLPFVFLSGHPEKSTILTAARFHADGFIVKPPKPSDIEKSLIAALNRPRPDIDPFAYIGIETGTEYDRSGYARVAAPEPSPELNILLERFLVPYDVAAISVGDILAKNLTDRGGRTLLACGIKLQAFQVETLQKFQALYGITQVPVAALPQDQMIMYHDYYGIDP